MKTVKTQEQLYNRILINYGIAALAYILLYVLYQKMFMRNAVTFAFAAIFLIAGIVCYVLDKKQNKPLKNYGHMFIAFCIALLFTRLSVIVVTFLGWNTFSKMQEVYFLKKLMQTRWEVIIISWAGAIYLVGMTIYNGILMAKVGREKKINSKIKK